MSGVAISLGSPMRCPPCHTLKSPMQKRPDNTQRLTLMAPTSCAIPANTNNTTTWNTAHLISTGRANRSCTECCVWHHQYAWRVHYRCVYDPWVMHHWVLPCETMYGWCGLADVPARSWATTDLMINSKAAAHRMAARGKWTDCQTTTFSLAVVLVW